MAAGKHLLTSCPFLLIVGTSKPAQNAPRPTSQHKQDLFAPEDKGQEKETKDEEEGERNKGEGEGIFVWEDKELPLD